MLRPQGRVCVEQLKASPRVTRYESGKVAYHICYCVEKKLCFEACAYGILDSFVLIHHELMKRVSFLMRGELFDVRRFL
jgi:hypothetical protein